MSQRLQELAHEAIQQEAPVQEQAQPENPVAEPEHPVFEATNLSATDTYPGENMVARRVMTIDRFVPGAQQTTQPPSSQGQSQVPPPSPSSQKIEGCRSTIYGSGRRYHPDSSPANRRYRHSRAADPGRSERCILLPGRTNVEA